ncbi:MAG TPA: urease accessory protein [Candidatus Binatia bacterium]|nr:urease accessory protein [Candidatus Binatia bacterium]
MRRYILPVTDVPTSAAGLLALGVLLGLRHALDVDHLAAVSTLVSARPGVRSSAAVGALWGLGHTSALLAAALVVVGLHAAIPPSVGRALELGVALMLIGLGVNVLVALARGSTVHVHRHRHGGCEHAHVHLHPPLPAGGAHHHAVRAARRPFWVGVVHGLAGSAGLTLAIVAAIPSRPLALAYVAIFGAGSLGGMVATTTLVGMPLAVAAARFARAEAIVRLGTALASVAVGLRLAWELGAAGAS